MSSANATTTPAAARKDPHALQLAETLITMAAAANTPDSIGAAVFATLPPGYTKQDLTDAIEKAAPVRNRKRGEVLLRDVDSLLAYLKDQAAQATAYVYAHAEDGRITAVFNDQRDAPAGWRDHRATFVIERTPEFKRWTENDRKAMDQTTFAEFIEDNLADITEPAGHQLLEVATTIQATSGINFASAKRLQDGQVQLSYHETIEARAGAAGALTIPKEFALGLRLFKNGQGYKLRARLKYRLAGGSVKFWYELDRPERAIEDAFNDYVEKVRKDSGYVVLLGRP